MKKIIVLILLVCLGVILVGCVSEEKPLYESIIVDVANDGWAPRLEERTYVDGYFKKTNMSNQSCVVLETRYEGSYEKSIVEKWNSYATDIYQDENFIEFGLRSDNHKLERLNLMNKYFFDNEPRLADIENPKEHAIAVSKEIAKKYVDNVDDYTMIEEEPWVQSCEIDGKEYGITYYVTVFARQIQGYFTSDYIAIKMTSKGNLASIIIGDIGAFSNMNIKIDNNLLNESVDKKVDSAYSEILRSIDEKKITMTRLSLAPNGSYMIYSYVSVKGTSDSGQMVDTLVVIGTTVGYKNK